MNIFQILVIAGLVVFMIVRRFTGQPVQANSFVLPLGITIYGLIQLRGAHVGAVAGRTQIAQAVRSAAAGSTSARPRSSRTSTGCSRRPGYATGRKRQVRIPERASRAVRRALAAGHSASVMP